MREIGLCVCLCVVLTDVKRWCWIFHCVTHAGNGISRSSVHSSLRPAATVSHTHTHTLSRLKSTSFHLHFAGAANLQKPVEADTTVSDYICFFRDICLKWDLSGLHMMIQATPELASLLLWLLAGSRAALIFCFSWPVLRSCSDTALFSSADPEHLTCSILFRLHVTGVKIRSCILLHCVRWSKIWGNVSALVEDNKVVSIKWLSLEHHRKNFLHG